MLKELDAHEEQITKTMDESITSAKSNYKFKGRVNSILVIIGVILITNPIFFFWAESTGMIDKVSSIINPDTTNSTNKADTTSLSYFLGGIGIVALVTTFFKDPQEKMTVALADLVQMHVICNMYMIEFHGIVGKLKEKIRKQERDGEECTKNDLKEANDNVFESTFKALMLIDIYIEQTARGNITSMSAKS